MAVPFDYPDNNITGIVDFLKYTNTLADGWLGAAILIIVGMVSFLATKSYTSERALGFASFLTLISAIFLRFLDLINDWILAFTIIFFIGSVLFLMRERDVEEV